MGCSAHVRRFVVVALLSALASSAWAESYHYQRIPLGERALGMGGAFTGVANEPSAVYYNPGGLTRLEDSALSASITISAFDRQTVVNGYRTPEGSADLTHSSAPSLPVFVSLVRPLGRRDEGGYRRHAVALSTLTIDQRRLRFDVNIDTMDRDARRVVDSFSLEDERSILWHGVSYAYRVSDRLSFGISSFLSLARWRHDEERLSLTLGERVSDTQSYTMPSTQLETRRTTVDVKSFVFRLGLLYTPHPKWRAGLMVQLPSFKVAGAADVVARSVLTQAATDPATATYVRGEQTNLRASWPLPWEIRVGGSYEVNRWITVAMDTSLNGRVGGKLNPIVAVQARRVDPMTGVAPSIGEYAQDRYYAKTVANAAVGAEVVLGSLLVLRAGTYTDISAAPDVPKRSDRYFAPDVNHFGGTISAGLLATTFDLSLGLVGLFGWGNGMAYQPEAEQPYARTSVRDQTLFVFISGAKRALTRLAKATYERIRERGPETGDADVDVAPRSEPPAPPAPSSPSTGP